MNFLMSTHVNHFSSPCTSEWFWDAGNDICRPREGEHRDGVALMWTWPQVEWTCHWDGSRTLGSAPTAGPQRAGADPSLSKIHTATFSWPIPMHVKALSISIWEEGAEHLATSRTKTDSEPGPGTWGPHSARCLVQENIWMGHQIFYSSSRCGDIVNSRDKQKITLNIGKWGLVKVIDYWLVASEMSQRITNRDEKNALSWQLGISVTKAKNLQPRSLSRSFWDEPLTGCLFIHLSFSVSQISYTLGQGSSYTCLF